MIVQKAKLRIAVILITLCAAMPALAQENYDKDCKPIAPESDQAFEINICRTHVACEIAARAVGAGCKLHNFISKVADSFSAKGKIDAGDVEQAAKPEGADSLTPAMRSHAARMTAEERARIEAEDHALQMRTSNAANDGPGWKPDMNVTVLPPKREGGFISVFEGNGTDKDGKGVLIGEDGMAKGNFKDGKLQGEGEQILADGTYRGGNYKDGQIAGKGFEFGEKDGKTFVTEGTFKADQPDGLATETFEDKSSQRVRWENGKIVARGPRAPAGTAPEDPKPMTDVELALAGRQPTDYVEGNLIDGTGIIARVRKDGTVQFEDWEDGKLMQVGVRAKKGFAISPQMRQKPTPQVGSYSPPPTQEEPRDVDPCPSERLSWAGHYQGQVAAKIFALENNRSPSALEPYLWDVSGVQALANQYRSQGVDPLHSPDFLRQVATMAHESATALERQARNASVQDNQTFNYHGSRTMHAWVACMADFLASGSRTAHKPTTQASLQTSSANNQSRQDNTQRRDNQDHCEPYFVEWKRVHDASGLNEDEYFTRIHALPDEAKLNMDYSATQTVLYLLGDFRQTRNTDKLRQMADTLIAETNHYPIFRARYSWGACIARRLADTLDGRH